MASRLKISKPQETRACSNFRNFGSEIPENQKEFCAKYNTIVDTAIQGLANLQMFEKMYFSMEFWLLREIEQQRARDAIRVWIRRKLRCISEKTNCGKDERGMLERITKWDNNTLRMYRFILENLEKKLFPEEQKSIDIEFELAGSPCQETGQFAGNVSSHGMILVPEGVYTRGSNQGRADEKPVHAVFQESFWIDRCEVTNAQFLKLLLEDPYLRKSTFPRKFHDGDYLKLWEDDLKPPKNRNHHPVVYVSWFAARYYCQAIGKRLPSEAEWEKAARAGTFTQYPFGDDPSKLGDIAWYNETSEGFMHPVASLDPTKFLLFDILGNAWEWVFDWYAPYQEGRQTNPQGPADGKYRVLRGGSWKSPSEHLRVSMRGDDSPVNTSPDVGFRCAGDHQPDN